MEILHIWCRHPCWTWASVMVLVLLLLATVGTATDSVVAMDENMSLEQEDDGKIVNINV